MTLATAGTVCGARSLYASAQWGRLQPEAVRQALGCRGPQMPGITTLHDVFTWLQIEAFERESQVWAAQQLVLDGNALRGILGEVGQRVRHCGYIQNRLHGPRDMTLGADACQVRSGPAPQALAAGRNAVLGLLHGHRFANLTATIRTYAWSAATTLLDLLGPPPPNCERPRHPRNLVFSLLWCHGRQRARAS